MGADQILQACPHCRSRNCNIDALAALPTDIKKINVALGVSAAIISKIPGHIEEVTFEPKADPAIIAAWPNITHQSTTPGTQTLSPEAASSSSMVESPHSIFKRNEIKAGKVEELPESPEYRNEHR